MLGPVRRFFKKVASKGKRREQLQVEIIEPRATDISQIEVELTDEMAKRRLSRERRHKVLVSQTTA